MKRIFILFFVGIALILPATSFAVTPTIAQQIELLKQQIAQLQALLAQMQLQEAEISAGGYIALDISRGEVLLQKDSTKEFPIASITKLMNAVISVENEHQGQKVTLTKDMLRPEGYSPALFLGAVVAVKDLIKAMLIQSTNDAAEATASGIGVEKYLELMNQKAKDLGMANTRFYDAHGLDPKNHSTAADLAKLLTYVYRNHPELLTMSKETNFQLPGTDSRLLTFKNVNNFYASPDFVGGKTGYLPEAKQSIASVFTVNDRPVAIVVLYSKNRQTDTQAILAKIQK